MAYFANGSEGEILENQCDTCVHAHDDGVCPISAIQMLFNYEQIDNPDLNAAMSILVDDEGICQMRKALIDAGILTSTSLE